MIYKQCTVKKAGRHEIQTTQLKKQEVMRYKHCTTNNAQLKEGRHEIQTMHS